MCRRLLAVSLLLLLRLIWGTMRNNGRVRNRCDLEYGLPDAVVYVRSFVYVWVSNSVFTQEQAKDSNLPRMYFPTLAENGHETLGQTYLLRQ